MNIQYNVTLHHHFTAFHSHLKFFKIIIIIIIIIIFYFILFIYLFIYLFIIIIFFWVGGILLLIGLCNIHYQMYH